MPDHQTPVVPPQLSFHQHSADILHAEAWIAVSPLDETFLMAEAFAPLWPIG